MPLWTIFTKWPAPCGAAVQKALLGAATRRRCARSFAARLRRRARARRRSASAARRPRPRRRSSGSSRARGRRRRRWCRRRRSGCPASRSVGAAPDVVAVVRVAAVDDDVARVEQARAGRRAALSTTAAGTIIQIARGALHRPRRAPRATPRRSRRPSSQRGDRAGLHVVDDAVVAALQQPPHHVRAHAAEADHSELHRISSRPASVAGVPSCCSTTSTRRARPSSMQRDRCRRQTPPRRCGRRAPRRRRGAPAADLVAASCRCGSVSWKPGQSRRQKRLDAQTVAAPTQAEQRLDEQLVHPAGRAGVPGPAAAADVRRRRVDVAGDDVRLDLVGRDPLGASSPWRSGSSSVEERPRALAVAERGERHRGPDRRVRVLAAVLAHAGHVALDVAGRAAARCRTAASSSRTSRVVARARGAACSESIALRGALGRCRAREHRPALRDRVDAALARCAPSRAACRRRNRRAGTRRRPSWSPRRAPRSRAASRSHASANAASPRSRASGAKRFSTAIRKKASQTLSPRPPAPTRFMPSFQSPVPISGRPCAP